MSRSSLPARARPPRRVQIVGALPALPPYLDWLFGRGRAVLPGLRRFVRIPNLPR